jgi:hypothetical protein
MGNTVGEYVGICEGEKLGDPVGIEVTKSLGRRVGTFVEMSNDGQ